MKNCGLGDWIPLTIILGRRKYLGVAFFQSDVSYIIIVESKSENFFSRGMKGAHYREVPLPGFEPGPESSLTIPETYHIPRDYQ